MLDTKAIEAIVPLRPPSLYIDRIVEIERGKRTVAIKNVTINEPYFAGMAPEHLVMPELMYIEIFGQLGNITFLSAEENKGKLGLLTAVNEFEMLRYAMPGDSIRLEFEFVSLRRGSGKGRAIATVDGAVVARAELLYMMNAANERTGEPASK